MRGVYRSAQWPFGFAQRLVAACASDAEALIGFTTGARVWRFRRLTRDSRIHVLVPHTRTPELATIVVHRCRRIDPVDRVERPDGIRVTSPARTLFDAADMLGYDPAVSVLEQLLNDGRCTLPEVADTLARLGHPLRPGTRTMRAILESRPNLRAAVQSDLEVRVLAEIARQGIQMPVTQYPIVLPGGRKIRVDFAWPSARLCLEVDHPFWHDGAAEAHRDKHRDRLLHTIDWRTIRITKLDVDEALSTAIADVRVILGRPSRAALEIGHDGHAVA